MPVGWSRRKRDEPDHPDQPVIVTVVTLDPGSPSGLVVVHRELQPVPYSVPEELQDDVIEPTAVYNLWQKWTPND
jgi:hypothetical protein